ncbi:MAG: YgaP family membrane protein [Syntrophobacteraceae bacterium]
MNIDRMMFRIVGIFILASLLLAVFWSYKWLWFTAFVGANLVQASFTGFCPMAKIIKAFGIKAGQAFE